MSRSRDASIDIYRAQTSYLPMAAAAAARPASLRSILTVEYWTRPLPPTPPGG
eukprot:gene10148-7237_t